MEDQLFSESIQTQMSLYSQDKIQYQGSNSHFNLLSSSSSSIDSPIIKFTKGDEKKENKTKAIKKKKVRAQPKNIDNYLSYDSQFDQNDVKREVIRNQEGGLEEQPNCMMKKIFSFNQINQLMGMIERPIENYRFFYCSGDIMVEIYNDRSVEDTQERRMKNFQNFKTLVCAEKVGDNMRLILNSKEGVVNDLQPVIQMLERKQDNQLYYFAQLLIKYNSLLKVTQAYIQSIIDYYRPNNISDLNIIRELRQTFHMDYMTNQIAKKSNDEFYCMVQVGPNFNTKAHGYNILQFSKAMVALLGTDEEEMASINMRNGFRDFIYSDNKNDMYIKYLEGILNGAENSKDNDKISFETKLFTYDHIIIPCKCLITRHVVPLPKQLEYKSTTGQYFNLDMINYMQFQIDAQQIRRVLEQRNNFDYQSTIKEQIDSFEYSVSTQIFMEKFYPTGNQPTKAP